MAKIVISDTSCLIALSKIDKLDLLKDLFDEIIISTDVLSEFGENLPDWFNVTEVKNTQKQLELECKLDKGEASSIALAIELGDTTLIIDEFKGRNIANFLKIDIIGTIGIIILAEKRGLILNAKEIIMNLVNQGFRVSDVLIDKITEKKRD